MRSAISLHSSMQEIVQGESSTEPQEAEKLFLLLWFPYIVHTVIFSSMSSVVYIISEGSQVLQNLHSQKLPS